MKLKGILIAACLTLTLSGYASPAPGPQFKDLDLVGYWHRTPRHWNADRFAPHVSWQAPDGSEQWLFEAFLFLEGYDVVHGKNLSLSPGGTSADKQAWEYQLDLWLGPDGCVGELERACAKVAERIGAPSKKRSVVIGIPDAIMFEHFADKQSSTVYWGDGLDFADVQNRIKAYKWYIDQARSRFDALGCKYLTLAGFYITSEDIHLPYDVDVNSKHKNWETVIPAVAEYCHQSAQGLYWIPYHLAPGYKYWKELGFDQAWMQPNWYWDLGKEGRHPFHKTIDAIKQAGMSGMELEFEFSAVAAQMTDGVKGPDGSGSPVFTGSDVPALQNRVRHYIQEFKDAGFLGSKSIALYSGSNALTQLASSPLPQDRALYNDICAFVLENRGERQRTELEIDAMGRLQKLSFQGRNYAGGYPLWRLYYNTADRKEIEISALDAQPEVLHKADTVWLNYRGLGGKKFNLYLKIWTEGTLVRFASRVENDEPHTIIRELQYPLLGDLQLPEDYKLLTTHTGGQVFDNPVQKIANVDTRALYMTPAQKFRQYDLQYPRNAASNCFAFIGGKDGLYFGSHDYSLQQTWHGLRAYPDTGTIGHTTSDFKHLEAGFYRYPNVTCGNAWTNDSSVIIPYRGDWTATSRIYRRWADTWWQHGPVPRWVQDMTGWQRIIFKHQYGEYLRRFTDLPGRIADVGESVGCNAVLAFGWWKEGMDNGYPNYTVDDSQGGDPAWKKAIADYRARGGRLLLYYNGRLIDVESDYYLSGEGEKVSNHDNTGREFTEHYKFTGEGTTLGYYDSRTFVIADMSKRAWRDQLIAWADRAMEYGSDAVFYDQLGVAEEFPNWDISGEFPIQDIFTGRYKSEALQEIRDHIKARNPDFALGTEWLSDCTSRYCDFVHIVEFTALPESFPEWFRYTFPEVVWSDRCVRDDNDVPRRVNNTLLKGLRNDIEVFRCRGLIDETPVYQAYLSKVNAIRHRFPDLLLEGRYTATDGFSCSNPALTARSYTAGDRLAVVVTNTGPKTARGSISAPGYILKENAVIGNPRVRGSKVTLRTNELVVLVFEKQHKQDAVRLHWTSETGLVLPEGIKVYSCSDTCDGRPIQAWYAIADCSSEFEFKVLYPGDGRLMSIDEQASENESCLVLINGGIFSPRLALPIGFAVCDGVQTPWRVAPDSTYLDRDYPGPDGQVHPVRRALFGVDKDGLPGVYWSFTPEWGSIELYDSPAGGKPAAWKPLNAVTCGPVLLKDGKCPISLERTEQGWWKTNYELWADDIFGVDQRHDRSAVGCTPDGKVILCAVDGRIPSSSGATTIEMARIMKGLGCTGAINLDGGGSTGMWVAGRHLNDCTGGSRPVMTTLGFFKRSSEI